MTFTNITEKNACATVKLIKTGFGGTGILVCESQKRIFAKVLNSKNVCTIWSQTRVRTSQRSEILTKPALIMLLGFFALSCIVFLQSCANQVPPSGGPPDKTLPQIVASEPIQRAINVHPTGISLLFNTFIDRREEFYRSLTLTPPLKADYSWFGKQFFLTFKEPLDSDITVALTIGTGYANWEGNKPETAYTLVFATGSKLDSGTIRGTLERTSADAASNKIQAETIGAFLYPLRGIKPDTLNPATTKPKYIIPLGSKGTFEFPALAEGAYRLFLVKDEFRNERVDTATDAFGTPTSDVFVPEGGTVEVPVFISPARDFLAPQLLEVRQISPLRFAVRWNKKIEPQSLVQVFSNAVFQISDSLKLLKYEELPRIQAFHANPNNSAQTFLYLDKPFNPAWENIPASQRSTDGDTKRYQLFVQAIVRDSAGNVMLDSTRIKSFSLNVRPSESDTAAPTLLKTVLLNTPDARRYSPNAPSLLDSMVAVPLLPRMQFVFSAALLQNIISTNASIEAASGAGMDNDAIRQALREAEKNIILENAKQQVLPVRIVPSTQANMLLVEPRASLQPNVWYSLGVPLRSIKAWNNAPLKDSVVILHFQTDDPRDAGAVSGTLKDILRDSVFSNTRFKASNNAILSAKIQSSTQATVRSTRANFSTTTNLSTQANTSLAKNIFSRPPFLPTTNGQYVLVLEAVSNLASGQGSLPQKSSLQTAPAQNPPPQNTVPQATLRFAERRFEVRISARESSSLQDSLAWTFENIPAGNYSLSVFYDANGNGVYDYGTVFPYTPAERRYQHPTEIQVRKRWTVENVRCEFP